MKRIGFEDFVLDLERHALYRAGERVRLTAKPLETLIFLIENRGRTVDKQELMDAVWQGTFVTEDNLVHAVREIRRALGDDKTNPRFVQTVPRQGYRFVAPARMQEGGGAAGPSQAEAESGAGEGPLPDVTGSVGYRRWLLPVGLIALASAIVLLWLLQPADRGIAARAPTGAALHQDPEIRLITSGIRSAVKPMYSPDGKFLLYVSYEPDYPEVLDLYVRPVGEGNAIRITDRIYASGDMPVFTADGTHVVFSRYGTGGENTLPDLWKVPISGGTPRLYIPQASGAGFSPDGKWVAYSKYLPSRTALWVSPVDDPQSRREAAETGYTPRWSPDGKWIAYTISDPNRGPGCVWLVSASLAERRQLTRIPERMYGLAWTADGDHVVYAPKDAGANHLRKIPIAGGPVVPLLTGVGEYLSPSTSPDGRSMLFCYVAPVRDLTMARSPDAQGETTISDGEHHSWLKLSPSGRKLSSVVRRAGANELLYVRDLETRKEWRLSDLKAACPDWLDEEHVVYLTPRADSTGCEIRVSEVTTGGDRSTIQLENEGRWLAAQPGSGMVAVVLTSRDAKERVVVCDLRSGQTQTVTEGGRYEYLAWRPDGRALSWSGPERAADPSSSGIWSFELRSPVPRRLFGDGYAPAWNSRGDSLYFARIARNAGLWRLDLNTRAVTRVRDWNLVPFFDIKADRLVFAQDSGRGQIYSMALK